MKTEMSPKLKSHQKSNIIKTKMTPKLKCHQKTEMAPKLICPPN